MQNNLTEHNFSSTFDSPQKNAFLSLIFCIFVMSKMPHKHQSGSLTKFNVEGCKSELNWDLEVPLFLINWKLTCHPFILSARPENHERAAEEQVLHHTQAVHGRHAAHLHQLPGVQPAGKRVLQVRQPTGEILLRQNQGSRSHGEVEVGGTFEKNYWRTSVCWTRSRMRAFILKGEEIT